MPPFEYEVNSKSELKTSTKQDVGSYDFQTTHIYSDSNSSSQTLSCRIEYENDESLDIKEEIIQDQETPTGYKYNKKYESKLSTTEIREGDILVDKNLLDQKKQKISGSKHKPRKEYKCEKCARCYAHANNLNKHKKFDCGVMPQFRCKLCGRQFKRESFLKRHIVTIHQKTKLKTAERKYNCEKCNRSYSTIGNLNQHHSFKHAVVKRHFICDSCGYKANLKTHLSRHIITSHMDRVQHNKRYHCHKCSRSFAYIGFLNRHQTSEHAGG
ncbi:zinc finger protein 676-like [Belonocnema kinseyi]|uniref:zinc finger protein 676-like n=1 Tax=Belonocnema kinseyi TaxID=2817044 RepID=UPI00143DA21D|nr:zinc finger protein 676-like [Belonocnema kinseyi]